MSIPFTCPICSGRGKVPNGFYRAIGTQEWPSTSLEPEPCRTCNQTGIVWSPSYTGGFPGLQPPYSIDCTTVKPESTVRVTDTPPSQ